MKRSILALALEEKDPDNQVIEFVGSLGEQFTKALNMAYNKDRILTGDGESPDNDGNPENVAAEDKEAVASMETQAMDAQLAASVLPNAADDPANITVYAVNKDTIIPQDLVNVTSALDQDEEDKQFVLVIDGTGDGENSPLEKLPEERQVDLSEALESIAKALDIPVYPSIQAFLEDR